MPRTTFDDDITIPGSSSGAQFVQLENKGEKIKFRMADTPFFVGKHWVLDEEKSIGSKIVSKIVLCPKVNEQNSEAKCKYCELFEKGEENPVHRSKTYKPTVQFYYPIVNRETKEAQIFQTSLSVHMAIKEAKKAGVDVYKADWQVIRNEGSPVNYYGTVRLDTIPLDDKEKQALKEVKDIPLESIFGEGKESSMKSEIKNEKEEREAAILKEAEEIFDEPEPNEKGETVNPDEVPV